MNRIFKFVLPGALLLLVFIISCKKDNPESGLFSNSGATNDYISSSELSIESAKNYFHSKKKESVSRDSADSRSIVEIMQDLELEWNLADTILYRNAVPVIVVPIKSAITPFHHSTMVFFLNEQNVIESRLFTVVTDSTYTPTANFSKNFNGYTVQVDWSGQLVHSYRIDNGVITGSVASEADSRNDKPICPPGQVLVIYMDDYTRYYDCITISSGGGGGGGGGNPFNPDPFGLGGGNGNNGNNNNGGGGSGANDYLNNFFDPNDFEGLAKKAALLVNKFKTQYGLFGSSFSLQEQLISECGLENNGDLYGELLEILNGPPEPCVQAVINNDRITFFQETYGLPVTTTQLQSMNNAGLLVNSNTFINFFLSKNLNAAQVTWLIQNMQPVMAYDLNFIGAQDIDMLIDNPDFFAVYTGALANSPNATQEEKTEALRFVFDAPETSNPITNLPEKLNCFDVQNNQNGTHKVTLFADQPVANSDECASLEKRGGHAFLGISQEVNGEMKSLNVGLYPQSLLSSFGSKTGVFNNDENHHFDVSMTWEVTTTQFNQLISGLAQFSTPPVYNVATNNCGDFAITTLQGIGITFDSPKVPQTVQRIVDPLGFTQVNARCPGRIGQDMRTFIPPTGVVTKNTSGGQSPTTLNCQ